MRSLSLCRARWATPEYVPLATAGLAAIATSLAAVLPGEDKAVRWQQALWTIYATCFVGVPPDMIPALGASPAQALADEERRLLAAGLRHYADAPWCALAATYPELLGAASGHGASSRRTAAARKTHGAYYTAPSLVATLIDAVFDEHPAAAPRLIDPACGSGHLLVAATRYLAARALGGDPASVPEEAMRAVCAEIIGRQVWGVDRDPLAVALCRWSLAKLCPDPEAALPAISARILVGDSLVGSMAEPSASRERCAQLLAELWPTGAGTRPVAIHWGVDLPASYDAILANPPWEQLQIEETQFFQGHAIATAASKSTRRQAITALVGADPLLSQRYTDALAAQERYNRWIRQSERFPDLRGRKINTYALFVTLARQLRASDGRAGLIVPTGIALDQSNAALFQALLDAGELSSLYDFENRAGFFGAVDSRMRFCLLILGQRRAAPTWVFGATDTAELADPLRQVQLSQADLRLVNPNTASVPLIRTARDAEWLKACYRRFPILQRDEPAADPWALSYRQGLFNMSADSHTFLPFAPGLVPLLEGKHVHHFTCWRGAEGPRFGVEPALVEERMAGWSEQWHLLVRTIARANDERTLIAALAPRWAVGNSLGILRVGGGALDACALLALLNSLVVDAIARMKLAGPNLNWFMLRQLALPSPADLGPTHAILAAYGLALSYRHPALGPCAAAAWEQLPQPGRALVAAFYRQHGQSLDLGAPLAWTPASQRQARAQLEALIAQIYGLSEIEAHALLDPQAIFGPADPGETFRVLRERERLAHGAFITAQAIRAAWQYAERLRML